MQRKIIQMSRPPTFLMGILLIFLLLALFASESFASRPLPEDYTTFKPKVVKEKHGFGSKQVEGCLPKGRRHSSAPSRYINYQPLNSVVCSPMNHKVEKP